MVALPLGAELPVAPYESELATSIGHLLMWPEPTAAAAKSAEPSPYVRLEEFSTWLWESKRSSGEAGLGVISGDDVAVHYSSTEVNSQVLVQQTIPMSITDALRHKDDTIEQLKCRVDSLESEKKMMEHIREQDETIVGLRTQLETLHRDVKDVTKLDSFSSRSTCHGSPSAASTSRSTDSCEIDVVRARPPPLPASSSSPREQLQQAPSGPSEQSLPQKVPLQAERHRTTTPSRLCCSPGRCQVQARADSGLVLACASQPQHSDSCLTPLRHRQISSRCMKESGSIRTQSPARGRPALMPLAGRASWANLPTPPPQMAPASSGWTSPSPPGWTSPSPVLPRARMRGSVVVPTGDGRMPSTAVWASPESSPRQFARHASPGHHLAARPSGCGFLDAGSAPFLSVSGVRSASLVGSFVAPIAFHAEGSRC